MSDETEIDLDNLELGDDLNLDGDFDMSMDEPVDDRSPVTKVKDTLLGSVKDNLTNESKVAGVLKENLPTGYQSAWNSTDNAVTEARNLFQESLKDVTPALRELKQSTRRLLPQVKKVLPESWGEKAERFLADDSTGSGAPSQAETDNAAIQSSLGSIFQAQAEQQKEEAAESTTREQIRDNLADKRAIKSSGQNIEIINQLSQLNAYNDNINAKVSRQALELQFRQFFTLRDLLEVTKKSSVDMTTSLETIVKNTALPDVVKIRQSETFMQQARDRVYGAKIENIGQRITPAIERLKTGIRDRITGYRESFKDGLSTASDMGNAIGDMAEMQEELGGGFDPADMAVGMAGDTGMTKLMGWLGRKVGGELQKRDNVMRLNDQLQYAMADVNGSLNAMAGDGDAMIGNFDVDGNGFTRFLRKGVQSVMDGPSNINDSVAVASFNKDNGVESGTFDNMTRKSIVEIIPELLSRILNESVIANGGKDDRLVFNSDRGRLTKLSDAIKDARDNIFSKKDEHARTAEIRSVVDTIDSEGKLSKAERAALSGTVNDFAAKNIAFTPKKFIEQIDTLDISKKVKNSLITKLEEQFETGKSGKEMSRETIRQLGKIAKGVSATRESILSDRQNKIVEYNQNGGLDTLFEAGILKEKDGEIVFNSEEADRRRDRAVRAAANRSHEAPDVKDFKRNVGKVDSSVAIATLRERAGQTDEPTFDNDYGTRSSYHDKSFFASLRNAVTNGVSESFEKQREALLVELSSNGEKIDLSEISPNMDPLIEQVRQLHEINKEGFSNTIKAIIESHYTGTDKEGLLKRMGKGLFNGTSYMASAAGKGLGLGFKATMAPFKLLGSFGKGVLSMFKRDKDPEKGFFGKMATKFKDGITSTFNFLYDNTIGRLTKNVAGKLKKLNNIRKSVTSRLTDPFRKLANRHLKTDLYLEGNLDEPVLLYRDMLNGHYFSKRTGKVLTTFARIDGDVVDSDGNILLKDEDIPRLVNAAGKRMVIAGLFRMGLNTVTFLPRKVWGGLKAAGRRVNKFTLRRYQTDVKAYVPDGEGHKLETVLYLTELNKGEYYYQEPDGTPGKPLKSFALITGPIIDREGVVRLTEDQIKKGLFDSKGKPLRTAGGIKRGLGLIKNTILAPFKIPTKLAGFVGDTLGAVKKYLFGDEETKEGKAGILASLAGLFSTKRRVKIMNVQTDVVNIFTKGQPMVDPEGGPAGPHGPTDPNGKTMGDVVSEAGAETKRGFKRFFRFAKRNATKENLERVKDLAKDEIDKAKDTVETKAQRLKETTEAKANEVKEKVEADARYQKVKGVVEEKHQSLKGKVDRFKTAKTGDDVIEGSKNPLRNRFTSKNVDTAMDFVSLVTSKLRFGKKDKNRGAYEQSVKERTSGKLSGLKRKVFGDSDGDGDRDGGYVDQMKAKAESAKSSALELFRRNSGKSDSKRNKVLEQILKFTKKNARNTSDIKNNTNEGFLEKLKDMAKWIAAAIGTGGAASTVGDLIDAGGDADKDRKDKKRKPKLKKAGLLRRMGGGLLRGAGWLARGALAVGGAAITGTTGLVVAGAVGSAAVSAGVMYGAYNGYKYFNRRRDLTDLERFRFVSYGLNPDDERQLVAIRYLEDELSDEFTAKGLTLAIPEVVMEYAEDFGIDEDDTARLAVFAEWLKSRFVPIMTTWTALAKRLGTDVKSIQDKVKRDDLHGLAKATLYTRKDEIYPYDFTMSPFSTELYGIREIKAALSKLETRRSKDTVTSKATVQQSQADLGNVQNTSSRTAIMTSHKAAVKEKLLRGENFTLTSRTAKGLTRQEVKAINAYGRDMSYRLTAAGYNPDLGEYHDMSDQPKRVYNETPVEVQRQLEVNHNRAIAEQIAIQRNIGRVLTDQLHVTRNIDNTLCAIYDHITIEKDVEKPASVKPKATKPPKPVAERVPPKVEQKQARFAPLDLKRTSINRR